MKPAPEQAKAAAATPDELLNQIKIEAAVEANDIAQASALLLYTEEGVSRPPSDLAGEILPLLELEDESGVPKSPDVLAGKIIGLYFSAGWCPPCRTFSPQLAQFQKQNSADFVVTFVSSDRSEADMRAFAEGKGFLRVPYESAARRAVSQKMGVSMLPTLVIVDGTTGKLITDWGRSAVTKNPQGCIEAWRKGEHGCGWFTMLAGSCSGQSRPIIQ